MLKKLKISCDEATTICDKSQYGKATLLEVIKLRIHFLSCKFCSLYTKQNNLLSKILKKNKTGKTICNMTEEDKELMRKQLEAQQGNKE